jgi:hypothetical protein
VSLRFSIPITLRSLGRGFHIVPTEEIEREPSDELPPIDYAPLKSAARDISFWLLDVARSRTDDPLDHTAIDRVHRALVVALAANASTCTRPDVSEEDLLTVAGILLTAFEVDLGLDGLGMATGSAYDAERDRETASMAAKLVAAMVPKRGLVRQVVRIVPWSVGRRPRVVDQDALDDVTFR